MHIPARHFAFVILSWFLLYAPALAQVDNLKKTLATGNINTGFDLPSGQTIRIESGASIIADAGSTVTGFGSAGAWGTITGTLSNQTDLNTALGLKANTADLGTLATLSAIASAQITDGTIVNADISTSAAIALSKLADSGTFALGATGQIAFETTALILSSAGITAEGDITANTLGGNGASITALNASNLTSGTVATARLPALNTEIVLACSDETTAVTAGTGKITFRMPYAMTVTGVRASTTTASTGGTLLTIDINESGSSILSTKLTLDASETTSTTAATAAVISDSSLASDAQITIDFDAVGSTVAGAGVKVTLIGTR